MNRDRASLDNLKDIAEPPPVGWWPPAIGWWVVLGLVLLAAIVGAVLAFRRWRARAYRRAALAELESTASIAGVSAILKRTALVAYSRQDVAALAGESWCRWLGETCGTQPSRSVRRGLIDGVFQGADAETNAALKEFAALWIRRHQNRGPQC